MALSYKPPPTKRRRSISSEIAEMPTAHQLPNEILAKIIDLVDDPWWKLQCKGVSKQFREVIGNKQSWNNSDMIQVKFSPAQKFVTINGRSFSMKKRWRALRELMTVIHTIRRFSFTYSATIAHIPSTEHDDFALLKAVFDRICQVEPTTLLEFTFKCKTWYLPNLKPVFQFIRSCSSVLESINIVLYIIIRPNILKRQKLCAIEDMWSTISTCNQLKHIYVGHNAYLPRAFIPLHPMSNHIRTALYSKHLKSLVIDVTCWDDQDEELFQLLQSLPLLEKLSLNMDPSEFGDVLVNRNLSIPVKELTFTPIRGREEYETDSFCQAVDMHLILNLMSLSNGRCPFDPVPIIDRIFQFWSNQQSNFLLDYNGHMLYSQFTEMLHNAVIEKDGSICAAPAPSPSPFTGYRSSRVYCLSRNNTSIIFSVGRLHCCLRRCSDCDEFSDREQE